MQSNPAPKRQALPCPNPECDAFEVRPSCETCQGSGELDSWTCAVCTRDFDAGDELPRKTEGGFECADCVRFQALEGWDFSLVAKTLGVLWMLLDRPTTDKNLPHNLGFVIGELKHLADRFAELAKDLDQKS